MYLVETDRPENVPIDDLHGPNGRKLVVRRGVPVYVTWEQKRASMCLRRLEALGHVTVSQGERAREEKPPRAKAQHVRLSRPITRPQPPPPESGTYTKEEVDRLVNRAATNAAKETASAIMGQLQSLLPSASPASEPSVKHTPALEVGEGLEARVEAAVEKALSRATFTSSSDGGAPSTRRRSSGPEEPLFIPTGIVSADDTTELDLQSESSEDEGLADAAAQLKKLRKGRKKES